MALLAATSGPFLREFDPLTVDMLSFLCKSLQRLLTEGRGGQAMDSLLLSEHQFRDFVLYLDTLIVSVYDHAPLDVAVPYGASKLIGEELASRVYEQFRGRAALRSGGESRFVHPTREEHLLLLQQGLPFTVNFGLLITDRVLTTDRFSTTVSGVPWLVFDWWQWLTKRLPASRNSDAWMYLVVACPTYLHSEPCRMIGFAPDVLEGMEHEGDRLYAAMQEQLANDLMNLWGTSERPFNSSL